MPEKIETKKPEKIPEVVEYLDADAAVKEFREEHAAIFEQFDALVDRRNSALEQAEKVVRAQNVRCGPFDLYQTSTKYDADKLHEAVGREKFLELGGAITTQTVYTIDKARVETAIAQKKLDDDVIAAVRTVSPSYHVPKKTVLP